MNPDLYYHYSCIYFILVDFISFIFRILSLSLIYLKNHIECWWPHFIYPSLWNMLHVSHDLESPCIILGARNPYWGEYPAHQILSRVWISNFLTSIIESYSKCVIWYLITFFKDLILSLVFRILVILNKFIDDLKIFFRMFQSSWIL